jgi:hypothetical protein
MTLDPDQPLGRRARHICGGRLARPYKKLNQRDGTLFPELQMAHSGRKSDEDGFYVSGPCLLGCRRVDNNAGLCGGLY